MLLWSLVGWMLCLMVSAGPACAQIAAGSASKAIASRYQSPFPSTSTKKGLQVELVDDALALGVAHAALNIDLCRLVDATQSESNPTWEVEGRQFHFRRDYLEAMDSRVRELSRHGVVVYLILLTYLPGDPQVHEWMIHPKCSKQAPNRLGAFNTASDEGRMRLRAIIEFLAERWGRDDLMYGRVSGWIVGNEVNSHWWWSNMGEVTMETFAAEYEQAVRIVHQAVRSQTSWGRTYISLEHHWNMRYPPASELQAFEGKRFLEHFAELVQSRGDFDWHVAFHPYPENLFEPRFWNDRSAIDSQDSPRITFKNLPVLIDFLNEPKLRFEGQQRRVILSEQGFHTPNTEDGEIVQAAAYCYAYKIVERMEGIDAFILHRHVDHDHEGGLWLGLRRNKPNGNEALPKKKIYEAFRAAGTEQWEEAFKFALPIVGRDSW